MGYNHEPAAKANMTQNWALTAAIFILGVFLGYVGRVLVAEIHVEEEELQPELEEARAKAKSLPDAPQVATGHTVNNSHTEAAILKNLDRNARR